MVDLKPFKITGMTQVEFVKRMDTYVRNYNASEKKRPSLKYSIEGYRSIWRLFNPSGANKVRTSQDLYSGTVHEDPGWTAPEVLKHFQHFKSTFQLNRVHQVYERKETGELGAQMKFETLDHFVEQFPGLCSRVLPSGILFDFGCLSKEQIVADGD